MIYHNTKNGFPTAILNEEYQVPVLRIFSIEGKVQRLGTAYDALLNHDMFGTTLAIRKDDEFYVISLDRIISDILEVENENQDLFSDH